MTVRLTNRRRKVRFFLALEGVLVGWTALALGAGAIVAIPRLLHWLITIAGLAFILLVAFRLPAYRGIKSGHHYVENG